MVSPLVVGVAAAPYSGVGVSVPTADTVGLATADTEVGLATAANVGVAAVVAATVGVAVAAGAQPTMRDKVSKSTAMTRKWFLVISYLLLCPP